MNQDRGQRAAFCSALPYLREYLTAQGRAAELRDAVTAVLADTPVQDALAGLGIPRYVLEDGATVRGEEPGPGDIIPDPVPRAEGERYSCPDGWCGRHEVREPGGPVPGGGHCWLRDRALVLTRA
ncbi:hypothetical protein GCM10010521_00410 [Streptomyces rameus]|uniref:Uncharacterized protein n=1 Tax=Streptomyces rameus TaxID=68261 RepID=A0ABP6MJE4_9ACTN